MLELTYPHPLISSLLRRAASSPPVPVSSSRARLGLQAQDRPHSRMLVVVFHGKLRNTFAFLRPKNVNYLRIQGAY